MHRFLRVLIAHGPQTDSAEEEQELRKCIASAPGIQYIKSLKRDWKGGYMITLELSGHDEEFLAHIAAGGYLPVLP